MHDVGGYTKSTPQKLNKPGLRSLRTRRTLAENYYITIEPGCYFMEEKL